MQPADSFSIAKSQNLVQSMKKLQIEKTKESEKEFINNLFSVTFLSPVLYESSNEDINHTENKSQKDRKINLLSLPNDNGQFFFPAFTDKEEFLKWNAYPTKQVIFLKLKDYMDVLSTDNSKWSGVVINPFSDNFVLNTEQIKMISNSSTIRKNESVMIGEPEEYPQKLVNALIEYLPSVKSVNRAYLLLMIRNKAEKSYLLVIDSNEDLKHIFDQVSSIASKYLVENENIDFVSYSTKFAQDAVKNYKPFYEKL